MLACITAWDRLFIDNKAYFALALKAGVVLKICKSVAATLATNSQSVAKPLSLQDASKAYAEGITQFRVIAKSINLQD